MEIGNNPQINSNIYLNANQSLNKIATGIALNQASDDASGLSIALNLQNQASGHSQAIENSNSALALTQIADGALANQSEILDNVREKLLQASSATTSDEGREAILKDIQGQLRQFNDIASQTNYNGQTLLQNAQNDQAATQTLQFQVSDESGNPIESSSIQSNSQGLNLDTILNQDPATFSADDARGFLDTIDSAINSVNDNRSEYGSLQNQFESTTRNLLSQRTATLSATDFAQTDYAAETSNFSKQNILAQIGAFSASQSNNINQTIVSRLLT